MLLDTAHTAECLVPRLCSRMLTHVRYAGVRFSLSRLDHVCQLEEGGVNRTDHMCPSPTLSAGQAKHRNSWMKEIVLGFMAGAFICFGFATCMIAAGQVSAMPEGLLG